MAVIMCWCLLLVGRERFSFILYHLSKSARSFSFSHLAASAERQPSHRLCVCECLWVCDCTSFPQSRSRVLVTTPEESIFLFVERCYDSKHRMRSFPTVGRCMTGLNDCRTVSWLACGQTHLYNWYREMTCIDKWPDRWINVWIDSNTREWLTGCRSFCVTVRHCGRAQSRCAD